MTSNFWTKTGKDTLHNGAVLGALLAAAVIWGNIVYDWLIGVIPAEWLILGEFSLPVYLLVVGALLGYVVDRA